MMVIALGLVAVLLVVMVMLVGMAIVAVVVLVFAGMTVVAVVVLVLAGVTVLAVMMVVVARVTVVAVMMLVVVRVARWCGGGGRRGLTTAASSDEDCGGGEDDRCDEALKHGSSCPESGSPTTAVDPRWRGLAQTMPCLAFDVAVPHRADTMACDSHHGRSGDLHDLQSLLSPRMSRAPCHPVRLCDRRSSIAVATGRHGHRARLAGCRRRR